MSTFTIKPVFRTAETRYDAPTMIVEASTYNEAVQMAKNSALGRFPEWTFAVNPFQQKNLAKGLYKKKEVNPLSKSQLGKKITGHSDSRPVRRANKRLGIARNKVTDSHHKGGTINHW